MPINVPVPNVSDGDTLPTIYWNSYIAANLNKLLNQQHRRLTVAQFIAITSPEDGDEVYVEADAANGVEWHLRYESDETTYFWRYLGGPALVSEVTTAETTASTSYAALTTAGPSIALPRAGDYDVTIAGRLYQSSGTSNPTMSYDIGGTGAVDADALIEGTPSVTGVGSDAMRERRKAGLATATLTAKYKVSGGGGGTMGAMNRRMSVKPVRIRHDA